MYYRCKNKHALNCRASVICHGNNLENAFLSIPHSHVAEVSNIHTVKFSKKIEQIISENPFKKSQDIYTDAKLALLTEINMDYIGENMTFLSTENKNWISRCSLKL